MTTLSMTTPTMTTLKIFQKDYQLPSCWKDCTAEQIRMILPLALGKEALPANRIAVLQALIQPGLSKKKIRRLNSFERFELLELVRWCWDTPMDACPIEHFTFEGKTYHLPKKDFSFMHAVDFAMGYLHMQIFLRSNADGNTYVHLDKLVATVCRPLDPAKNEMDPAFDGERRERYTSPLTDHRTRLFASLDVATKIMVLQYFIDFHKHIQAYDIFEKSSGEPNSDGAVATAWIKMLFDIAETGVFGDIDKVYYTDIHTILFYLQKKKQERLAS